METSKERVRRFLSQSGPDLRGRQLAEILAWPDDELEHHHDFIQWLFPLELPSGANPDAPVVSPKEFAELAKDPKVLEGVRSAFARMLAFYGLQFDENSAKVTQAANWQQQSQNWAQDATHNDLRITRILHSLTLFGLKVEAQAFYTALEEIFEEPTLKAKRATALNYWQKALQPGDHQ
jgi:hypothetical protein